MMRPILKRVSGVMLVAFLLAPVSMASGDGKVVRAPRPAEATDIDKFHTALRTAGIWSGGPEDRFENLGRKSLAAMINYGLMPDHKVLDVGAGSLRVGWWLFHYIEPSNYYAIEPVRSRIDPAVKMLGVDIHTYYNEDFEFPDVKFDFVIARSIWTHASKVMIAKMLSEFAENSSADAKFLASVLLARSEQEDYKFDHWVGKVEKDDRPAMIRHSQTWLEAECKKNGLTMAVKEDLHGQTWILVSRSGPGRGGKR